MYYWHALPADWESMKYLDFLPARQSLIAGVIQEAFDTLSSPALPTEEAAELPAPPTSLFDAALADLPKSIRPFFRELLEEPLRPPGDLLADTAAYLERLEDEKGTVATLDIETARYVADRCSRLVEQLGSSPTEEAHALVQAAVTYFVNEDDADHDIETEAGLLDDKLVAEKVEALVG